MRHLNLENKDDKRLVLESLKSHARSWEFNFRTEDRVRLERLIKIVEHEVNQ